MRDAGNQAVDPGLRLLLFGPQEVSFDVNSILQLTSGIQRQPWALRTLSELPSVGQLVSAQIPDLHSVPAEQLLTDLQSWLLKGPPGRELDDLPNTILAPLTTLSHLIQYRRYVELRYPLEQDAHAALIRDNKTTGLGFCTGVLAAFAAAGAADSQQWELHAAAAVRLAALIGIAVDAADKTHASGASESYGTTWRSRQDGRLELERIITQFPADAYVSVWYDECRATVTVSQRAAPKLLQELQRSGIAAVRTRLRGRFHWEQHGGILDALIQLCDSEPELFGLSQAESLHLPTYVNHGDSCALKQGPLYKLALHAMLVEQCNWYGTLSGVLSNRHVDKRKVISFSKGPIVPPSLTRQLGSCIESFASEENPHQALGATLPVKDETSESIGSYNASHHAPNTDSYSIPNRQSDKSQITDSRDIAIVGMSVKVAGADDLDGFESILRAGISQHQEVPSGRVPFGHSLWRRSKDDEGRKWYGNFLRDADAFDHKFFRKSPRESAAMDPQQRLVLQAAYQAVEQSGYYTSATSTTRHDRDRHIGVYLGTCATDYSHNAACHSAGAFTVTGLLRGFIAGKISHFFGWTGPSMTFDTTCSGSTVAIHSAVRALQAGECSAALAGGVNIIGDEAWFQNLAGAQFLSPTGQCKPFDEGADGYCRGEGIACVLLKPMAAAIADGDQIFGRIASTAVYQNDNSTPLFVPNAPSLSRLFTDVVRQARLEPRDISLVEAHGTGTPVGDPAEYQSIRAALGGALRKSPLSVGSVKGLVGHTESTSGVVSLIKVLLMMQGSFIPPQASHSKLSQRIDASPSDMIQISTIPQPWSDQYKAALINNYGASGSNAAMVITQPPFRGPVSPAGGVEGVTLPFWICGFDSRSIAEYCAKLATFVHRQKNSNGVSLSDLCFNINRQSNRTLSQALLFRCSTIDSLVERLSLDATQQSLQVKAVRPVILCFGGQSNTFVGLDHQLFKAVPLLMHHLDQCDAIIQSLGLGSIYPDIFAKTPINDTAHLQTMLFSLQYASAKCWMDCGTPVKAVVGHSFGEITALCISQVLGLTEAIRLVAGRAKIVNDSWGPDRGVMMAVEGELEMVQRLLEESNNTLNGTSPASIACYNAAQSFTLAGSSVAMQQVEVVLCRSDEYASLKYKKLNVTNAFHSALVDPLLSSLERVGAGLTFHTPQIRIERATETASSGDLTPSRFVANHMRAPVFFHQAVQRLARDYPSAIWMEAGSASKVTSMAKRSAGWSSESHFQGVNITDGRAMENLTDTTLSLWKEGLRVTFWAHYGTQAIEHHVPLILPPYQFEKSRHWLHLKAPPLTIQGGTQPNDPSCGLWTFIGYQDAERRHARFKINTEVDRYKSFVMPHVAAQTAPICPATLQYNIAIQALLSLHDGNNLPRKSGLHPIIREMRNDAPLCVNSAQSAWLDLEACDGDSQPSWVWRIITTPAGQQPNDHNANDTTICVYGKLELLSMNEAVGSWQFEKLGTHEECLSLLQDDEGADSGLQGRSVYRSLADVVDYGELYRRVRRVAGRGNECAGIVQSPSADGNGATEGGWLNIVPVTDSFSQVAGLWVNCMADREPGDGDMFLATGCEVLMSSPALPPDYRREQPGKIWHVWAKHNRESKRSYTTDVLVFDAEDGRLVEVMLGIKYNRIPKQSMSRLLGMLTEESVLRVGTHNKYNTTATSRNNEEQASTRKPQQLQSSHQGVKQKIKDVISNVTGVAASEIADGSELADLGIDSLAGMELARELEDVFSCKLDLADLLFAATSFREFASYISQAMYGSDHSGSSEEPDDDDGSSYSVPNSSAIFEGSHPIDTPCSEEMSSDDEQSKHLAFQAMMVKENSHDASANQSMLPQAAILEAFAQVKASTDQRIKESKVDDTDALIVARSNRLCVALVVEAFDTLGCPLRSATTGQIMERIEHAPEHTRLVDWLYSFLEKDARLIDIDGSRMKRTSNAVPHKAAAVIFEELLQANDRWVVSHKLANYAGKNLADVISGNKDGLHVLFGSPEGRDLVRGLYSDLPFNRIFYEQMRDSIRLTVENLSGKFRGPLRILEMGAGTCGTTHIIVPYLATLNIPVEYTVTDLSPSMVAQARRNFGSQYPFMRFAVHDIEKQPADNLRGTQHVVIASNAVHATAHLAESLSHLREALRPDGVLLLTEMTEGLPFVDLTFGLLEGWWRFADERQHAIVSAEHWEVQLRNAGFNHVDWTDGNSSENRIQKVIMALASGVKDELPQMPNNHKPDAAAAIDSSLQEAKREAAAEQFVRQYSAGFMSPTKKGNAIPDISGGTSDAISQRNYHGGNVVVITGATGSLGSHLVARFSEDPSVNSVICLNRRTNGSLTPLERQHQALSSRGLSLSASALSKLRVLAADTTQSSLGLPPAEYAQIVMSGTHIVHNAWPMSASRPLRAFEPQMQSLRRLLDLAADIGASSMTPTSTKQGRRVCFQFVSSIGVVGQTKQDHAEVFEERVRLSSVLPNGYCEAKWVCERMLEETVHQHPDIFRSMVVRPGQIAGSSKSGVWNPVEHFAFLIRSAQALRAFPSFEGRVQWVPVDAVAGTIADLALDNEEAVGPVYHIDNPIGQPWREMAQVLAEELDIPNENIIPFPEWVRRVKRSPLPADTENPALRLVEFLEGHFERMSCGGIVLDTSKAREYSQTLAGQGPVPAEVTRRYVRAWKAMGFLSS